MSSPLTKLSGVGPLKVESLVLATSRTRPLVAIGLPLASFIKSASTVRDKAWACQVAAARVRAAMQIRIRRINVSDRADIGYINHISTKPPAELRRSRLPFLRKQQLT